MHLRLVLAALVATVALAQDALANTIYTSEAAFLAAAGPGLSMESFETYPIGTYPFGPGVASFDANGFTVTDPNARLFIFDETFYAAHTATHGDQSLFFEMGFPASQTITITFDAPTDRVGFTLKDALDHPSSSLSFATEHVSFGSQFFGTQPDGGVLYFGLISTQAFTTLTITTTLTNGDGVNIDEVVFNEVPEPATLALLGLGAGAVTLRARRARRA